MNNPHFTMQEQTILQAIPTFPNDQNFHPNILHIHVRELSQLSFGDIYGNLNIEKVEHMDVHSSHPNPQPQQAPDRNRRAVLAVHQQGLCTPAEWAVVVKLLEEQGTIPKSAYQYAAAYINDICGIEVTNPRAMARSVIYTKVIGHYPDWRIKEDEQSRKAPNILRKFKHIAQVFIDAQSV